MTDEPDTSRGLLDTSIVIDYRDLLEVLPAQSAISTITLGELSGGLFATNDPHERVERQARLQWVEARFNPLPFDADAARTYGSLCGLVLASARRPRKRIADIQIAATAVANGLTLYTRNPDDFKGMDGFLNLVAV